ncbi:MAG: hypothetical protein ABSB41_15160 [Anaerolineales bacterium]
MSIVDLQNGVSAFDERAVENNASREYSTTALPGLAEVMPIR